MANPNFTCVLDAWRDGTTLYGRMHYYRSGSYYYSDSSFPNPTMNLGGSVYTDSAFGDRVRAGIYVGDVYSTTFSRTVGGTGTRTVTWSAGSGQRSDFAGTWSKDVGGFPGTTSPPTDLSFTGCTAGPDWYDIGVSVSGWGNGGSAAQRYIEAQVWTRSDSGLVEPRRYQASYGTTSATIRVNNSSSGSLTITPNTIYTVGIYATNGAASAGSARVGNHCSAPPVMTSTASNITETSAVLNWSFGNQGGAYSLILEYSLDGTNWNTMSTQTGSGAKSGTYTVSGLTAGTAYSIRTRIRTTNTSQANYITDGNTVSVTTYKAPNTPTVSASAYSNAQINVTYGTTSFNNPSTGTVYLYGGTGATPTTEIASKTTTGNSTYNYTGLASNTKYSFRSRAYNGQFWSSYSSVVNATTLPSALASKSASPLSSESAKVSYSISSDGGALTKYIEYSLDNSTWQNGASITGGTATSGYFIVSGLSADTTHTIYLRVRNSSGSTSSGNVQVTTYPAPPAVHPAFIVPTNQFGEFSLKGNTTQSGTPTPSAPQTVNTVTGRQVVGVYDKNLFNYDNASQGYLGGSGQVVSNSTAMTSEYIEVDSSTAYTASANTTYRYIGIGEYTANKDYIQKTQENTSSLTITTSATTKYIRVFYNQSTNVNKQTLVTTEAQIEKSSTATPYQPHYSYEVNLGKNLYEGSQDWSGVWSNSGSWTTDANTYNGLVVKKKSAAWNGLYKEYVVEAGKTYTFSAYVKADSSRPAAIYTSGGAATISPTSVRFTATTSWQRYTLTFTASITGTIRARVEAETSLTSDYVYVCGYQLELGSIATTYAPYFTPIELCKIGDYQDKIYYNYGKNRIGFPSASASSSKHTLTVTGDGIITVNGGDGTGSSVTNMVTSTLFNLTSGNKRLTLIPISGEFTAGNIGISFRDSSDTQIAYQQIYYSGSGSNVTYDYTDAQVAQITKMYLYISNAGVYNNFKFRLQLTDGTTDDPNYQPYVNATPGWYVHKAVYKNDTLNTVSWGVGSQGDTTNGITFYTFSFNNKASGEVQLYSNYFTQISDAESLDHSKINFVSSSPNNGIIFNIKRTYLDTQDSAGFNKWIGDNKVVLYYPLATFTETKITNADLVDQLEALSKSPTFGDDTNIDVTSENLPLELAAIYRSSRKAIKMYAGVKAIGDFRMNGDTKQNAYTGKNLFLAPTTPATTWQLDYVKNSDNSITLTRSAGVTTGVSYAEIAVNGLSPNTQYTVSFKPSTSPIRFRTRTDGTWHDMITSDGSGVAFTSGSSTTNIAFYNFQNGDNYLISPLTISDIQIEKGSIATSYEPYVGNVPAPNPDYPQEVRTVTGRQVVDVYDKNLLDITNFIGGRIDSGVIAYGADTSSVTVSGNSVSFTTTKDNRGILSDIIQVLPSTAYTFSGTSTTVDYRYVDYYDNTGTWLSRATGGSSFSNITFTTPSNCYSIRISFRRSTSGTGTIYDAQLEKGSSATAYQPHYSYEVNLGKNLFDLQNATSSDTGRMTISVGSDSVSYEIISASGYGAGIIFDVDIKKGQQYTLKAVATNGIVTNVRFSNGDWDTSGAYQALTDAGIYGSNGETFIANNNYTKFRLYVLNSGHGGVDTGTFSNIQLEKGSTATSYAPYISHFGKNLFNKNSENITLNKYLNSNNTETAGSDWEISEYIPIVGGMAYTTSGTGGDFGNSPARCYYTANKTFISGVNHGSANPFTDTAPSNAVYMRETIRKTLTSVQIEQGSTATPYQQFIGGQLELCKIGDYQDYIYKSGDDWYVHKETGLMDVATFTDRNGASGGTYRFIFALPNDALHPLNTNVGAGYGNIVPLGRSGSTYDRIQSWVLTATDGLLWTADTANMTLAQANTWLASHPFTVYYPLTTPTNTQITNADLIAQLEAIDGSATFGDQTTLTVDGDLPADATANFTSARRILKLYGSANGTAKLVFEE